MKITDVRTVLMTGPSTNDRFLVEARKRRSAAFIGVHLDESGAAPLARLDQKAVIGAGTGHENGSNVSDLHLSSEPGGIARAQNAPALFKDILRKGLVGREHAHRHVD